MARSGMARHGGSHDADRSGSGDQDILAENRKRKGRVNGVAEGIENRGDVEINRIGVMPDVRHRQGQIFGERAGPIDADALGVGAEVAAAGQAIAAPSADDVAFSADDLTGIKIRDIGSDLDDLAHELVTHHHRDGDRFAGPIVPFIDVNVGAADAGPVDLDQDVIDADLRLGNFFEPKTFFRFTFDKCLHRLGLPSPRSG